MNQDIIDYLEGHWEKGYYVDEDSEYFYLVNFSGGIAYFPVENTLRLSGKYFGEGYEVQIQDLQHLIQLEALL